MIGGPYRHGRPCAEVRKVWRHFHVEDPTIDLRSQSDIGNRHSCAGPPFALGLTRPVRSCKRYTSI